MLVVWILLFTSQQEQCYNSKTVKKKKVLHWELTHDLGIHKVLAVTLVYIWNE